MHDISSYFNRTLLFHSSSNGGFLHDKNSTINTVFIENIELKHMLVFQSDKLKKLN